MNVGKKWHVAAAIVNTGSMWMGGVRGAQVKNLWQRMRGHTERAKQEVQSKTEFSATSGFSGVLFQEMQRALQKIDTQQMMEPALADVLSWDVDELDDHLSGNGCLRSFSTIISSATELAKGSNEENCSSERLAAIGALNRFYSENRRGLTAISSDSTRGVKPSDADCQKYAALVRQGLELMRAVVSSPDLE